MPRSAKFLLEVSEPVSLKVNSEDYFREKKCQDFTFLKLFSLSRKRFKYF